MVKDERGDVPRQLLIGLGALLATALVIGGTVSVVALGAANLAGVGAAGSAASEEPSLYRPTAAPSPKPSEPVASEQPAQSAQPPEPEPQADPAPADKPEPKKQRHARGGITLNASPDRASTYEHIYLTGTYPGGDGATLQVQRFEGRWVDFPASATLQGGTFETYVESGQGGENRFRVIDQSTGRASQPASVVLH